MSTLAPSLTASPSPNNTAFPPPVSPHLPPSFHLPVSPFPPSASRTPSPPPPQPPPPSAPRPTSQPAIRRHRPYAPPRPSTPRPSARPSNPFPATPPPPPPPDSSSSSPSPPLPATYPIPGLSPQQYILPVFEHTSPLATITITLSNHRHLIHPHRPISGYIHLQPHKPFLIQNLSLWFFCELAHSTHPDQPPSLSLFRSDGHNPFRIPIRPPTPPATSHAFSFDPPRTLPPSHLFQLIPYHSPRPHNLHLRYRLLSTAILLHPNPPNTRAHPPHTLFVSKLLTLLPHPSIPHSAYLTPSHPRLNPRYPPPTSATHLTVSNHAIAISLATSHLPLNQPFAVSVTARLPHARALRARVAIVQHLTLRTGPVFRKRPVDVCISDASVHHGEDAAFRFEVFPTAAKLFPSAKCGALEVEYTVEAAIVAWAGWGEMQWRDMPDGGLEVCVPVVVLPSLTMDPYVE